MTHTICVRRLSLLLAASLLSTLRRSYDFCFYCRSWLFARSVGRRGWWGGLSSPDYRAFASWTPLPAVKHDRDVKTRFYQFEREDDRAIDPPLIPSHEHSAASTAGRGEACRSPAMSPRHTLTMASR